jgi:hypothetical protein
VQNILAVVGMIHEIRHVARVAFATNDEFRHCYM